MNTRDLQRSMYEVCDASMAQRLTLAGIAAVWVGLAWWLLFCGGLVTVGGWFGWIWRSGNLVRRVCLAAALSIYYARILVTEFIFLKRGVSWSEVFTILPWTLCIYLLLAVAGGANPSAMGVIDDIGVVLFVVGSWMNSYAEYARHIWKQRGENRGMLYTQGLFRYCRHPNYLGDLVAFSGLCLTSGKWVTVVIPTLMLAGFVFVNIPVLDSHLHDHYGAAFDDYARRTSRLFPFLY